MGREAMIIEFADGRRAYSPEIELTDLGDGRLSIDPIIPFRFIPENTKEQR